MSIGNSKAGANFDGALRSNRPFGGAVLPVGRWTVACYSQGATEKPKWSETFDNLITTEGANELLYGCLFGAGGSTDWYIGLKSTGAAVVADTAASHASWTELTNYADPRVLWAGASSGVSAGSVSNSTSVASFTMTSSANIAGAFLQSASSQAATTGVLYAAGDFSAEKDVVTNDTLEVTATFTAVTSSG